MLLIRSVEQHYNFPSFARSAIRAAADADKRSSPGGIDFFATVSLIGAAGGVAAESLAVVPVSQVREKNRRHDRFTLAHQLILRAQKVDNKSMVGRCG